MGLSQRLRKQYFLFFKSYIFKLIIKSLSFSLLWPNFFIFHNYYFFFSRTTSKIFLIKKLCSFSLSLIHEDLTGNSDHFILIIFLKDLLFEACNFWNAVGNFYGQRACWTRFRRFIKEKVCVIQNYLDKMNQRRRKAVAIINILLLVQCRWFK